MIDTPSAVCASRPPGTWFLALHCAVLTLAATHACFAPDLERTRYGCSATAPECPPGFQCQAPWCEPIGAQRDQGETTDQAGATGDLGPTPGPDLARPPGCADGGGYALGTAWACPGTFGTNKAPGTLCAKGFAVCKAAAPALTALDLANCRRLKGMYIAESIGSYRTDVNQAKCDASEQTRVVYGCGESARAQDTRAACSDFGQVVDCTYNTTQMRCPTTPFTNIDLISNPTPTDGVLCCPNP